MSKRGAGARALIKCPGQTRWRRRGLGDREPSISGKVLKRLHRAARPPHRKPPDHRILAQAEMNDRFAARHESAPERQRPDLDTDRAFQRHLRSDAEPVGPGAAQHADDPVPGVAFVAQQRHPRLVIAVHKVHVAVAGEVAQGRPEAHPLLVQPPGARNVFEAQAAQVAKRKVRLGKYRAVPRDLFAGERAAGHGPARDQVLVVDFPIHPVRDKQVGPPVVVQVLPERRPGPAGRVEPGEVRRLQAPARPGVQKEGARGKLADFVRAFVGDAHPRP